MSQAEVIVVDNGSTDGTREYLKTENIPSILLDTNKGVAAARNIGIQKATGTYIMLLDDDAWIENIDMQEIQTYFRAHTDTALLAPKILYPNKKVQESVRSFPTVTSLLWRGSRLYKLFPHVSWYTKYVHNDITSIHEIDWAIGACLVFPKSVYASTGSFDEGYFFGYEDTDFCYRLKKQGYKNMFWPTTTIIHEYARISSSPFSILFWKHIYSILRFYTKRTAAQ